MDNRAGRQEELGLGIGLGVAGGRAGRSEEVGLDRAGALACGGEGAERIEMEQQLGGGRGLGDGAEPVRCDGPVEAGVQGDRRQLEDDAVEDPGEVFA